MKTPGRSVIVAVGAFFTGLLLIPPVYLASAALLEEIDKAALESRIAMLEETAIGSPSDLQALYRSVQTFLLPLAAPAPDCSVGCEEGMVVFDPKAFEGWTDALEPEERHGVAVYPVVVAEDPDTRETLFLSRSGKEIARIEPEKDYEPFACFAAWWPELLLETADPDEQAWQMAVYDPARVSATYYLLSAEDVEAMAEAMLAAEIEEEPGGIQMMMGEGLPAPVSNLVFFAIEQVTNGMALGIGWPDDFTNKLEVFARDTIATIGWSVLSTNLFTFGTNSLWWVDTSITSNTSTRFYRAGNADQDSDLDGLTDARERFVYGTAEDDADTDADGMNDGFEIVNELDPFTDDGMDNPDDDGFVNAEEALKGTDPQIATGGGGSSVRFYYDLDDRLMGVYFATNGAVQYEYGAAGNIGRIQERRAP